MLKVDNLNTSVNGKQILNSISLEFEAGKRYAIMGPNGSGKSTFLNCIMGNPTYELPEDSHIWLNGEEVSRLSPHERAQRGIFLSFQSPVALGGVKVSQLIQLAVGGNMKPLELRGVIKKYAEELGISQELLSRPLNQDASGGEKKKLEVLQALVLDKPVLLFDEVDTGVDVDALKIIARVLQKYGKDKTVIIVTHYNRILSYLKPDKVIVIQNGAVVKTGTADLAQEIEKNGYIAQ